MPEPLGYSREGDIVTLRMTVDDFVMILISLGYAASPVGLPSVLGLANRINVGNPDFTPYEVPVNEGPQGNR